MINAALSAVHPQWLPIVKSALLTMDSHYLEDLNHTQWLPGFNNLFNVFSTPKENIRFVLFGESPYPREISANGYAFWDSAVTDIWSPSGLSKPVNRATSLRHIIKMLLHAEGVLQNDFSQEAISTINKSQFVSTLSELFQNFLNNGFLLLNATPVLSKNPVQYDVKHWQPFMAFILNHIAKSQDPTLLLWGKKALLLQKLSPLPALIAEHPYHPSFVTHPHVIEFFKPLHLLHKNS